MTTTVYVGVDSGGTRTNVDVLATRENAEPLRASYEVSESISGTLDPLLIPQMLDRIYAPLGLTLESLGIDSFDCFTWISSAGFAAPTRDDFAEAIHGRLATLTSGNVRAAGAANDTISLLLGSRANGAVIAGTGSNLVLQAFDGSLHQAGGHDWVACDYGSGFWIGLRSIRQAYRDYEAGMDSVLLQRLRQVYGLRKGDHRNLVARLRGLAIGDADQKKDVARFTTSVCSAAERGDIQAQNIVKSEAEDLADVAAGALRRRFSMDELAAGLQIVQGGSLFRSDFYRKAFESQLVNRLLSGIEQQANIDWIRLTTAAGAATTLAEDLESGAANQHLSVELAWRPVIVTS